MMDSGTTKRLLTALRSPLTAIMALAAGLRLYNLSGPAFWYDESFTGWMANLPFGRMILATAGDVHPPLWYAIEWFIQRLFFYLRPELSLRLLPCALSLLAIYLVWRLAARLQLSRPATICACLLMALTPLQVFFAQEARQYAALQVLVLLAILAILDGRRGWLAIILTALLYLHNYGLIYAAALFALDLYRQRTIFAPLTKGGKGKFLSRPLIDFAMPYCTAWLAFAPWMVVLSSQMASVSAGYWIEPVTPGSALLSLTNITIGAVLNQNLAALTQIVAGIALVAALAWSILRRRWTLLYLLTAPLILAVAGSIAWKPIFLWRALIACMPAFYLLLGEAITDVGAHGMRPDTRPNRRRIVFSAFALAPILIINLVTNYTNVAHTKNGDQEAIRIIRENWQPGDQIIHLTTETPLVWMYRFPDLPQSLLTYDCPPISGQLTTLSMDAMGIPRISSLPSLQGGAGGRSWLLVGMAQFELPCHYNAVNAAIHDAREIKTIANEYLYYGLYLQDGDGLHPPSTVPPVYDITHTGVKALEATAYANSLRNWGIAAGLVIAWLMVYLWPKSWREYIPAFYAAAWLVLEYATMIYLLIGAPK